MSILHRVGTTPGRARGLSPMPAVAEREDGECPLAAGALRRARGKGAVHPDHHRERLRQALLGLRISPHQPRRPGHHQHRHVRAQRLRRRVLPRAPGRSADAGHRPGQDDPHHRRRHPHRWAATRRASRSSGSPTTSMSSASPRSRRARRKRSSSKAATKSRPVDDAVVGESELDKPADPEPEE